MKTERQTTFKLLPIIFSYQANRIVGQENIIILTNKSVFLNEQFRKLFRGVYEERSPSFTLHTQNQLLLIKRDMTCRQQGLAVG